MSEEAESKANDQAEVIKKRIDALKLEIVATGHALATTGDDIHQKNLAYQRETLELLTFAEKQRPAMYGYLKSLGG